MLLWIHSVLSPFFFSFFFFNDTATTEIYTLSLHDALPIWRRRTGSSRSGRGTARPARGWRRSAPSSASGPTRQGRRDSRPARNLPAAARPRPDLRRRSATRRIFPTPPPPPHLHPPLPPARPPPLTRL